MAAEFGAMARSLSCPTLRGRGRGRRECRRLIRARESPRSLSCIGVCMISRYNLPSSVQSSPRVSASLRSSSKRQRNKRLGYLTCRCPRGAGDTTTRSMHSCQFFSRRSLGQIARERHDARGGAHASPAHHNGAESAARSSGRNRAKTTWPDRRAARAACTQALNGLAARLR